MSSLRQPSSPPKPLDLEIIVISAKHLKNVNWRHGDLKPYAVVYIDPERRAATKPDDSGSTRPVWNERLSLLLPLLQLDDPSVTLTIDLYHSKLSDTPKPLIGTVRSPLKSLLTNLNPSPSPDTDVDGIPCPIKTLELRRPSGRPQGKIRIKLAIKERPLPLEEPNYHMAPPSGYYYSTAPPPPHVSAPARDYGRFSPQPHPVPAYIHPLPPQNSQYPYGSYSDPYLGYYASGTGYYSVPPAPTPAQVPAPTPAQVPARSFHDRGLGYGGPSAPMDYSGGSSYYERKTKGSKLGTGSSFAVGAVAGALGALAIEEGVKYEDEKIAERVETELASRDDYNDYRADY